MFPLCYLPVMKLSKDRLATPVKNTKILPESVKMLNDRLKRAYSLTRNALATSQAKMKRHFDQRAVDRSFQPGDKVVLLLPVSGSALSVKFSSP